MAGKSPRILTCVLLCIVCLLANVRKSAAQNITGTILGTIGAGRAATTQGFHVASVHCLKATTSLPFRPSAFKLPTLSSNSSTMSSNDVRRNSLFTVLVACPAVPISAETGGHEQDRSKRKVFATYARFDGKVGRKAARHGEKNTGRAYQIAA